MQLRLLIDKFLKVKILLSNALYNLMSKKGNCLKFAFLSLIHKNGRKGIIRGNQMSRNTIIILILLIPISIWLNLYAYYKYGRLLINKRKKARDKGSK